MSDEEWTEQDERSPRRFGDEIIEPGEPFSGDTLDAIRAMVSENEAGCRNSLTETAAPAPETECEVRTPEASPAIRSVTPQRKGTDDTRAEFETASAQSDEQRGLRIGEGAPGRFVRHVMSSPRWLALILLSGVTYWRPLFIPALAFVIIFAVLLIGVFIGQDRMGRILLYFLKRYVWADPARGRALQQVLPRRWHPFLYKPITEDDAWEGPVDPRFEARLARLKS